MSLVIDMIGQKIWAKYGQNGDITLTFCNDIRNSTFLSLKYETKCACVVKLDSQLWIMRSV